MPGPQSEMDVTWLPTVTMDPTGYYMFLEKENICQMTIQGVPKKSALENHLKIATHGFKTCILYVGSQSFKIFARSSLKAYHQVRSYLDPSSAPGSQKYSQSSNILKPILFWDTLYKP